MLAHSHTGDPIHIYTQRAKVAQELLDTERTYVEGLCLIERVYINPLLALAQTRSPILTRKEIRRLFANFPDIVSLNKELLSQLEERLGQGGNEYNSWDPTIGYIGDVFVRIAPFLKMYSLYLRNFRSALSEISLWLSTNPEFATFIQQASLIPECKGLSFQSYLLLPVQRIPRYKLLLDDLLRYTPQTHVDYQNIVSALHTIEDVASFVNENIQEHEMTLSIIEIQRSLGLKESLLVPGRRLIKVGSLMKICRKNHQKRHFYLFNDIILYTNTPNVLMEDQTTHRKVPLEDCKVMNIPDTVDCRNQFTIISREKSFIVYAHTFEEKREWIEALCTAISERQDALDTLQMDGSLKRRIARARRKTMLHFPRVVENYDAPVWVPDEVVDKCYICFRKFTIFTRRHHCRACGKVICHSCSKKNIMFVGQSANQPKESRACDQCVARLFGRNALESPQGSINKPLAKPRNSENSNMVSTCLSSYSHTSINTPADSNTPIDFESIDIDESLTSSACYALPNDSLVLSYDGNILEGYTRSNSTLNTSNWCSNPDLRYMAGTVNGKGTGNDNTSITHNIMRTPNSIETRASVSRCDGTSSKKHEYKITYKFVGMYTSNGSDTNDTYKGSPFVANKEAPNGHVIPISEFSSDSQTNRCNATMPKGLHSDSRTDESATNYESSRTFPRAARARSMLSIRLAEWDDLFSSARSTLFCQNPLDMPSVTTSSPISTLSRNRISLVSSLCSTITSESTNNGKVQKQKSPVFSADDIISMVCSEKKNTRDSTPMTKRYTLINLLTNSLQNEGRPRLISSIAPPELTLAQAETSLVHGSRIENATLCTLCSSDFTIFDAQHQCSVCNSLVCSKCINLQRLSFPRMNMPSPGYNCSQLADLTNMSLLKDSTHQLSNKGELVCDACAKYNDVCINAN